MEWFIAAVVIVALGFAAAAAAGGVSGMNPEPVRDVYRQALPEQPLRAEDIRRLRFGVRFRGYAMDQVDELLERLAREIAARDEILATRPEPVEPPRSEPFEPPRSELVEEHRSARVEQGDRGGP